MKNCRHQARPVLSDRRKQCFQGIKYRMSNFVMGGLTLCKSWSEIVVRQDAIVVSYDNKPCAFIR